MTAGKNSIAWSLLCSAVLWGVFALPQTAAAQSSMTGEMSPLDMLQQLDPQAQGAVLDALAGSSGIEQNSALRIPGSGAAARLDAPVARRA